jgi:endoglucanase
MVRRSQHRCAYARSVRVLLLASVGLLACLINSGGVLSANASEFAAHSGIRVSGNRLLDGDGHPIRLIGVNRSGTEYACIRGWGIFEGGSEVGSIQVISSWHANSVRIGLNEDCWLGINGVPTDYAGARYQQAVIDYVNNVTANGMYTILDLHWSAPGTTPATSLRQMPDQDHSVDFWQSVATTFADNPNIVFDVFNEPFGVDWDCWRDGCDLSEGPDTGPWQAVGMQTLVNVIRATGATQPIMVGGLWFANDVSEWRSHQPDDPLDQLVVSWHVYPFNRCNNPNCWDDEIAPLATSVPVIVGEVGTDWTPPYSDAMALELMRWADDHQLGYLAWSWNTWGGGDALLTNYDRSPTSWGADLKRHFAELAVPRSRLLANANVAYTQHDLQTALELYEQTVRMPKSKQESEAVSAAIDGLARFRELVGLTILGEDDRAQLQVVLLSESDPGAPLSRLAAQFWDQYTMTASAHAACAQLAPQVDSQAGAVLDTLGSLGVNILHDELCVVP